MTRDEIQEEALQKLIKHNYNGVVVMTPGSGKALGNNELVLTPNGFVKNGELKKGDYVIGSDGKPKEILEIFPQGKKQLYKITFDDKTFVKCDLNHLWRINRRNIYQVLSTQEILNRKYKYYYYDKRYNTIQENLTYKIPLISAIEFNDLNELPLDSYTLGVLLGDGGFTASSPILTISKPEIKDKLIFPKGVFLSEYVVKENCMSYGVTCKKSGGINKNPLTVILKNLGIYGEKSIDKSIPKDFLFSSIENRKNLLQGLLDTDGYNMGNGIFEYSTSSEKLAKDFLFLVRSLGISAKITDRIPKFTYNGCIKEGHKSYRIYLNYKKKFKYIYSIEKDEIEEATCIYIDSDDHLYATNDFILTHNTKVSIDAIKKGKFNNILITSPRTNLKSNWRQELSKWNIEYSHTNMYFNPKGNDEYYITLENIQTCYKWSKEKILSFNLIIYDEIHTCGEEYSNLINIALKLKIPVIGLTGTPMEKNEFKKNVLYKHLPIIYKYLNSEKDGIINKTNYWVYYYELSDNNKVITGTKDKKWLVGEKSQYDYLTRQYELAKSLMYEYGSDNYFIDSLNWMRTATGSKKEAGRKFFYAIKNRKEFLWTLQSSVDIALNIKNIILSKPNNKVLLFSELTSQAEKLSPYSIHSNNSSSVKKTLELNKDLLLKFNSNEIKELSSVKSLTLGLNLTNASYCIFESYNGGDTDAKQKGGRLGRLNVNDTANAIIIVPVNTQAEIWFNNAFGYIDNMKIIKNYNDLINET